MVFQKVNPTYGFDDLLLSQNHQKSQHHPQCWGIIFLSEATLALILTLTIKPNDFDFQNHFCRELCSRQLPSKGVVFLQRFKFNL